MKDTKRGIVDSKGASETTVYILLGVLVFLIVAAILTPAVYKVVMGFIDVVWGIICLVFKIILDPIIAAINYIPEKWFNSPLAINPFGC